MPEFFTVDRVGRLQAGQVLTLEVFNDLQPPELQSHVNEMFGNGVSRHGNQYFLSNSSVANVTSPSIEVLFEYVRRAHFANRPSRFQSWFGLETVAAARNFHSRFGSGSARIWRLECDDYFRGNMNLLTSKQTTLVCSWFAHCYWRSEQGPVSAFWEYLLVPPVRVLQLADPPA